MHFLEINGRGKYYFKLSKNHVEKALKEGVYLKEILPFQDLDKIYESSEIFPIFKIRLPDLSRYSEKEKKTMLDELNMEEYDEFIFLEKTKGILLTDKFIIEKEK